MVKENKIGLFSKVMIITIICLAALVFTSNLYASSYDIEEYNIEAKIMSNGNMHVVEYIKCDLTESINGLTRDLMYKYEFENQKDGMGPTSSRYQASDIANIKVAVSDNGFNDLEELVLNDERFLSNGMKNVYSVTDLVNDGYRKNIKVYTPGDEYDYKYVKYEYDIIDVAVQYNDASEIYWNFIGSDGDNYIEKLNIKITSEMGDITNNNLRVYPHSYNNTLKYQVENGEILVTATNVPAGLAVDTRVVFPKDIVITANKNINENYNYALLEDIESKEALAKKRYILSERVSIVLVVCGIIGLIVIIIETNKIVNKGKKKSKDVEIYTDFLDTYSLSKYACIMDRYASVASNNLLLATILDLVNKKYIIMEPKKKLKTKAFDKIEYDYDMKLNNEKDFSTLDEFELRLVNYLFDDKKNITITSFKNLLVDEKLETDIANFKYKEIELNSRLKEISKNTFKVYEFDGRITKQANEQIAGIYDSIPKKVFKFIVAFVVILVALLFINTFVISPSTSEMSFAFCIISFVIGLISVLFASSAKSLKTEYVDEYNKLMGLKKYLNEYSLLKDRYPIEIKLWDRYLVFASLFGIANKVSKEFKEELIAQGYDDDYINITYPLLNVSVHSESIKNSFAAASGSSSSGGYSGGGSGGGGGRRWRNRFLLKISISYIRIYKYIK